MICVGPVGAGLSVSCPGRLPRARVCARMRALVHLALAGRGAVVGTHDRAEVLAELERLQARRKKRVCTGAPHDYRFAR